MIDCDPRIRVTALHLAKVQRLLTVVRKIIRESERADRGLYRINPADWLALQSAQAAVGRFADGKGGS
jgi:hypothetical protein